MTGGRHESRSTFRFFPCSQCKLVLSSDRLPYNYLGSTGSSNCLCILLFYFILFYFLSGEGFWKNKRLFCSYCLQANLILGCMAWAFMLHYT